MTGNKSVKTEGCSSCSCAKECLSEALLQGSFIRDDGVIFTATMTATGVGETACDAQEQSYKNIIKTLEDFITNYTPKIVEVTYELTYSITCDGKSTCCQPKICKKYFLNFKLYTKNVVATVTKPDIVAGGSSFMVAFKEIVYPCESHGDPFCLWGDAVTTVTAINKSAEVDVNTTGSTSFTFNSKNGIGSGIVADLEAEIVEKNTGKLVRGYIDLSQATINTKGSYEIDTVELKKNSHDAAAWYNGPVIIILPRDELAGAASFQFWHVTLKPGNVLSRRVTEEKNLKQEAATTVNVFRAEIDGIMNGDFNPVFGQL